MTTNGAREDELAAFVSAVSAHDGARVSLNSYWQLWMDMLPRLAGTAGQTRALAEALDTLRRRGEISVPVTAWDRSTNPPLPKWIMATGRERRIRDRAWTTYPWGTQLGWVASLPSLSDAVFVELKAINSWLVRNRGVEVATVPSRYRSAELFGDEKRLDAMSRTKLFGPGRLSFDLLGCRRIPAPLPAVVVGDGPDVLVVENSDPYWVAVEVLTRRTGHPVGAVVWGSGNTFPSQVAVLAHDVAGAGPVSGTVWYWGDLDPRGVMIALDAAAVARTEDLPRIRPAIGLWEAMAAATVQRAGAVDWSGVDAEPWLGRELWSALEPVRAARGRVAQESVPIAAIEAWAARTRFVG